jgi:hypothetical protein
MAKLNIEYVLVRDAQYWDENPKDHDLPSIIRSIEEHGFRDPPEFDGTLQAIVAGNGRMTALAQMEMREMDVPKYIELDSEQRWCAPMIFGADSASIAAAKKYAVDHNLLTMNQPLLTAEQVEQMFSSDKLTALFEESPEEELPITLSASVLEELSVRSKQANDIDFDFDSELAEGFAEQKQFGDKIQLVVDLTSEQADNADLKQGLLDLSEEFGLAYRIKTRR